jgi:hypothetical protein
MITHIVKIVPGEAHLVSPYIPTCEKLPYQYLLIAGEASSATLLFFVGCILWFLDSGHGAWNTFIHRPPTCGRPPGCEASVASLLAYRLPVCCLLVACLLSACPPTAWAPETVARTNRCPYDDTPPMGRPKTRGTSPTNRPGPPKTRGTSSNTTPRWPQDGQDDPRWRQDGLKWPKMAPTCRKMPKHSPKIAPIQPTVAPKWPQDSPRWPNMALRQPKMATTSEPLVL